MMTFMTGCGGVPFGGDWGAATGPTWTLTRMQDDTVGDSDMAPTLTFAADGRAVGHAGVNRYFATYERGDTGRLSFAAIGSTRMAGSPDAMRQEQRYLDTLGRIDRYALRDGRLTLYVGEDEVLRFE